MRFTTIRKERTTIIRLFSGLLLSSIILFGGFEVGAQDSPSKERALTVNSEFFDYCAKGSMATAAGRYDEAIDYFKKAISLKPDVAQPHFDLGLAYDRLGKFDLAIQNYEVGFKLNPNFVPAYIMLAKAYIASQGDLGKALWAAREAKKRDPNNQQAIQMIHLIEGKIKSMPGGAEMLENEEKYKKEGVGIFQSGNFTYIGPINTEGEKSSLSQSTEQPSASITSEPQKR